MPANFCLDANFDQTLSFLNALRNRLLNEAVKEKRNDRPRQRRPAFGRYGEQPVKSLPSYIDFSTIRHITTTAALVMAAYYDRRKAVSGRRLHTVDEHKWRPEVVDALVQLGFKELLQLKAQESRVIRRGSTNILQFILGERADVIFIGKLQDALAEMLSDDERGQLLDIEPYGGMLEAILNSHSWAYPDDHAWDFAPLKRWWVTGSVDTENALITVAAYDQGVSIPASLPRWRHFRKVTRLANRLAARTGLARDFSDPKNDGLAIQLAMEVAKSATGLPQHGKGLNTMLEVAQRAPHGRLRVLSRNGEYLWATGENSLSRSHAHSIGGTLVEWRLRLR